MRLVEFEGKLLRLHIPSWAGVVKAERVYWHKGRVVGVFWLDEQDEWKRGIIKLPYGSGISIEKVREELKKFISQEEEG